MPRSVQSNFLFTLLNTFSQLVFPLITFPYASRIMLADGIGQVNFFNSIISYISLFTCLGIPLYAVREIAKVRSHPDRMAHTAVEIVSLHALLTFVGYLAVAVICLTVAKVQTDIPLFLILSLTIFFTAIGCEWFYQGIEDFKYVAIRGLVVKSISIVLLFLLVKTKEDLLWYGVYNVFGVLGGNVFNFIRLRKYIRFRDLCYKTLHPLRHLKPALHIFAFNVITSIYLQLNTVLLGFMKDSASVGYFTAGTRIMYLVMSISSALGTVMLPRASHLVAENKLEEFRTLIQKSYDFILALTLPLCAGLIFVSKYAVLLLCGEGFESSVPVSQIVALNIVTVGISGVLGMQILYPMGKINVVMQCTFLGAVANVLFNVLLIPAFSHDGTAVSFMLAELVVTVSMCLIGRRSIPIRMVKRQHLNYVFATAVMCAILYGISLLEFGNIATLLCMSVVGSLAYFLCLQAVHDPVSQMIFGRIARRIGFGK